MGRPKKELPNHGKYYEVKVTITDSYGKKSRKSFYSEISKENARRQAKEYEVSHNVSEITGETTVDKGMLFSAWSKKWLEIYKKPNVDINTYSLTYENNVNKYLSPYFGKFYLDNIKPINVQNFFNENSKLSESVLKKLHMCLTGIFDTAIDNDLCRKNPAKYVAYKSDRQKNIKNVYSDAQIDKVKAIAYEAFHEVAVILGTGVRRGEVLGLMWDDFSESGKTISVNRSIADLPQKKGLMRDSQATVKINPPKWNSYRTIPISDECVSMLVNLPHNGDYIFPKQDKTPQSPNTWSQKLKRFMKSIHEDDPDITILSAHELRHTFGTMLRRHGVDIYTIQKIMGHKDIKMTTEIYVHEEIDVLRKDMKLDGKNGTGVVQVSYGKKYHIKRGIKKSAQAAE